MLIVLLLARLYDHYGALPSAQGLLRGAAHLVGHLLC
jgi:chromate transport protein ChrA